MFRCAISIQAFIYALLLSCSSQNVMAQQSDSQTKHAYSHGLLNNLVQKTLLEDCYATSLLAAVELNNNQTRIKLKFENEEMISFWTNDVAVQYLYDAAMSPIVSTIFGDNRFAFIDSIHFIIYTSPRHLHNEDQYEIDTFEFWVQRQAWQRHYSNEISKADLYRTLNVHLNNSVLHFNPEHAAAIE